MAVTTDQLTVDIKVSAADASKSLKKLSSDVEGIAGSFSGLGSKIVIFNQGLEIAQKTFSAFSGTIKKSIQAFAEADQEAQTLRNTLRVMGQVDVENAASAWEAFGDQLQKTTTASGGAVVGLVALSKAAGLSDKMTRDLINASVDLAAINGGDLNGSFRLLLDSLKGQGRGLASIVPGIRELSQESLKAGAAIQFMGERFAGLGAAQAQTFSGQMIQTTEALREAFEKLGRVIVEAFDLAETGAILKDFLNLVAENLNKVANGFAAVKGEVKLLIPVVAALGTAMLVVFGPAAVAALNTWRIKLIAANAGFLPMIANVALITAGILALAAAIDIVYRNFKQLDKLWTVVSKSIQTGLRFILDLYLNLAKTIVDKLGGAFKAVSKLLGFDLATDAIDAVGRSIDEAIAGNLSGALSSTNDLAAAAKNVDFGFVGEAIKKGSQFLKGFNGELSETAKSAENTGKGLKPFLEISEESKKQIEELNKLVEELGKSNAMIGANQADAIRLNGAEQFRLIAMKEDELIKSKGLTSEAKKLLALGRERAGQSIMLQLQELEKNNLEEIIDQNKQLELIILKNGATSREMIELDRKASIDAIQKRIAELAKEPELHARTIAQLEQQKKLITDIANIKKSEGPSAEFEQAAKFGTGIAKEISGAFTQGALSVVGGAMTGASAIVSAVDAMIDFIPDILNQIAEIFNKLTELPNKILEAIQNVFSAVVNFIENFIPNILSAVPEILDTLITGLFEEIPNAVAMLLEQLPQIVTQFLDKLPDIVEKFVVGLITVGPKIAISLIEFIIKDAPRIALAIMKTIIIELPKAIIKGIVQGVKQLVNMLKSFFSGKSLASAVQIDTKSMTKGLKSVSKALTGEASKMFAVMDLSSGLKKVTKGGGPLDKAATAFQDAMNKGSSLLSKLWSFFLSSLKKIWDWIWDKILSPFIDLLKAVWEFVYSTFIKPLLDGLMAVWTFIYESILKPFVEILSMTWKAMVQFLSTMWNAMIGYLRTAWNGIIEIFKSAWNAVTSVFRSLWDMVKSIWQTMMDLFSGKISILEAVKRAFAAVFEYAATIFYAVVSVFQSTFDAIGKVFSSVIDGFKNVFGSLWESAKGIGNAIWDAIKSGFSGAGSMFANLGTAIWDALKSGLSGMGDFVMNIFKKLSPFSLFDKIFAIDYKGKGTVEKFLNIDIPFANFATGGTVPGQAKVAGDSFMNDRVLALLSPGEAVIPRSKMNNPAIKALVDGVLSGAIKPPGFYWGEGAVNMVKSTVKSVVKDPVGTISSAAKSGFSEAVKIVKDPVGAIGGIGKDALEFASQGVESVAGVLKSLDPTQLWNRVKSETFQLAMKAFEANKFHSGGLVPAFAGGGEVPSMLQSGEFVMNRGAVGGLGLPFMKSINSGQQPGGNTINIDMKIDTKEPIDEAFVRNRLMPRIKDELRRASLDGQFMISGKGIR